MYDGYNRIFWGIFITRFSINLGPIKILPGFIGFLMIVSGLGVLYEESSFEPFKKVKSLAMIVTSLSIIGGVVGFFTGSGTYYFFLNTIWLIGFIIIEFVFYFRIMEVSVEYLNIHGYDELRGEYILKNRKYIIFSILNILVFSNSLIFNFKGFLNMSLYMAIFLSIYLMTMVYGLRNIFVNPDSQDGESETDIVEETEEETEHE